MKVFKLSLFTASEPDNESQVQGTGTEIRITNVTYGSVANGTIMIMGYAVKFHLER